MSRASQKTEHRLYQSRRDIGRSQQDADQGIGQMEIMPNKRPCGLTGAEDEFIEELDCKEDGNRSESAGAKPVSGWRRVRLHRAIMLRYTSRCEIEKARYNCLNVHL